MHQKQPPAKIALSNPVSADAPVCINITASPKKTKFIILNTMLSSLSKPGARQLPFLLIFYESNVKQL
jgi:hypothetical protein